MANKPILHGRDHRPGGADPIPSVAATPIAHIRDSSPFTVAGDNTDHYLSLQDAVTAHFDTSDTDVFNNSSTTTFTGSALYGIGVLKPGTYRYEWNATVATGGTSGATIIAYWSSSGGGVLSEFQQGRTKTTIQDTFDLNATHLSWTEYQSFADDSDCPGVAVPYIHINSGTSANIHVELVVTRVNTYALTNM